MDKQIIIDGVDVSGCEDYGYRGKAGYWCHNYDEPCSDYFDCRYKQLKRKEQECEELKDELRKNFEEKETLHLIIDRLLEASGYDTNTANAEDFEDVYENMRYKQQQLKHKEQECERLKKELDNELQWHKSTDKIDTINHEYVSKLKAENEELRKCYKNNLKLLDNSDTNTTKLVNKVMKYEQTLKEIKEITEEYTHGCAFSWECEKCNYSCFGKQILQKISEVENG